MPEKKIDLLNVVLILLSLAAACILPFELFLFSYAVLGPLHYLTEINWLNEKGFFVRNTRWTLAFLLLAIIISVPVILSLPYFPEWPGLKQNAILKGSTIYFNGIIVLSGLALAIGLVWFDKNSQTISFLAASALLLALILVVAPFQTALLAFFITTVIHVYLFTVLFMIYGNFKTKSAAGATAIILMFLVPVAIFLLPINPASYLISNDTQAAYLSGDFQLLNQHISRFFSGYEQDSFSIHSAIGIKTQIFIAFCYTYHYLNWFSETSIIGWNRNISWKKFIVILLIWLGSVLLYRYDYKTGFTLLFFLSILHVLLEFPLNITSIKGILEKMRPHSKA